MSGDYTTFKEALIELKRKHASEDLSLETKGDKLNLVIGKNPCIYICEGSGGEVNVRIEPSDVVSSNFPVYFEDKFEEKYKKKLPVGVNSGEASDFGTDYHNVDIGLEEIVVTSLDIMKKYRKSLPEYVICIS